MKLLLSALLLLCMGQLVSARAKIPFGKIDKLEIVADLPDTEHFEQAGGGKFLDLARLHQEYNIAWVIPAWVTEEPKLVLAAPDADEYYELSDEQLNQVLTENKLDKEKLLALPFYTRYGGKIILVILLALILYGFFGKEKKDPVKTVHV